MVSKLLAKLFPRTPEQHDHHVVAWLYEGHEIHTSQWLDTLPQQQSIYYIGRMVEEFIYA